MNKTYKKVYEAPKMESLKLRESMNILSSFSLDGTVEDLELGSDWGGSGLDWELEDPYIPKYPQ